MILANSKRPELTQAIGRQLCPAATWPPTNERPFAQQHLSATPRRQGAHSHPLPLTQMAPVESLRRHKAAQTFQATATACACACGRPSTLHWGPTTITN